MLNNYDEAIKYIQKQKNERTKKLQELNFYVCTGTGCMAKGAKKLLEAFENYPDSEAIKNKVTELKESIRKTGCCGPCTLGPLVMVMPYGYFYCNVSPEDVDEIIKASLEGKPVEKLLMVDELTKEKVKHLEDSSYYKNQHHFIFRDVGTSECYSLDDYLGRGGYEAFINCLFYKTPEEVNNLVTDSALRGRGGGGFPTGRKWEFARKVHSNQKYVVCNGDEGDPGAFMDRVMLEKDPHSVIEGMLIAAFVIGANKGYAYIRAEYPIAIEVFTKALKDAKEMGLLGNNILGTDFSFDIEIKEGAGAFVCGEETALLASIEGQRGVPRPRPPFPAQEGLWGKPTIINNVETLANIPHIIKVGPEAFKKLGTSGSPGTKMFSVSGPVKLTGLVEVEFGTTLRKIIFDIAGGLVDGEKFKAVQIGGPSGACLSESYLDFPLDYDNLKSIGAMVGSGGLVVIGQKTCMVEVARFFTDFTSRESCGKCIPCREGTMQVYRTLEKFTTMKATMKDLDNLEFLAGLIKTASQCGLGQTAPNPIFSTLKLFRDEYHAHINGVCPSGMCVAFKKYSVIADNCKGCGLCAKFCPQNAISGERGKAYLINNELCSKCGLCVEKCKFAAIEIA